MSSTKTKNYEILESLGHGGQGKVRKCIHIPTSKEYAVKIIRKDSTKPKKINRLLNEINVLAKLKDSEHIVQIQTNYEEVFKSKIYVYIVMELCDKSLNQYLEEHPSISINERFRLYSEILTGIKEAHTGAGNPIVHRDLKPANILLKEDHIKIADFGICFEITKEDIDRFTTVGENLGPWGFIAPEQEFGRNDDVTEKVDFYSLGKILYYLLSNGRYLAREYFKDEKFSLVKLSGNPRFDAFNEFFSKTINEHPNERYSDIFELIQGFNKCVENFLGNPSDSIELKQIYREWKNNQEPTMNRLLPFSPPILRICIFPYDDNVEISRKKLSRCFPTLDFIRQPEGYIHYFYIYNQANNPDFPNCIGYIFISLKGWIEYCSYTNRLNLKSVRFAEIQKVIKEKFDEAGFNFNSKIHQVLQQSSYVMDVSLHNCLDSYSFDGILCKWNQTASEKVVRDFFQQYKLNYPEICINSYRLNNSLISNEIFNSIIENIKDIYHFTSDLEEQYRYEPVVDKSQWILNLLGENSEYVSKVKIISSIEDRMIPKSTR